MDIYAPSEDNNDPDNYASFIANKLGVSKDTPINKLDPKQIAEAISQFESPAMYLVLKNKGIFSRP